MANAAQLGQRIEWDANGNLITPDAGVIHGIDCAEEEFDILFNAGTGGGLEVVEEHNQVIIVCNPVRDLDVLFPFAALVHHWYPEVDLPTDAAIHHEHWESDVLPPSLGIPKHCLEL